ncbi:MAG: S9 family peptidase [Bacteroidales bacterium]
MKTFKAIYYLLLVVALAGCTTRQLTPPVAEKIAHQVYDGRTDNYYWMRLTDEQKNDSIPDEQTRKVLDYLKAENTYCKEVMKHTEGLQSKLFTEMTGRIKQNDESVPYFLNGYYYYNKFTEGKEYPVYLRRKGSLDSKEEVLLDVNALAAGKSFCSVTGLTVSRDNKLLAYATDFVSRRQYTLELLDLETGKNLPDKVTNTTGNIVWAADNKTLFYTTKDPETLRSCRVMKHVTGTPASNDKEVFFEKDETYSVYLGESKSQKYIFIVSNQTLASEVLVIDASRPDEEPVVFEPRRVNHEYSIDHLGSAFYIRTNKDGAENFKLMKTDEKNFGEKYWKDVIPHRPDVLLEGFELFDNFIVTAEMTRGLHELRVIGDKPGSDHYIKFGEDVYTCGLNVNPTPGTKILRYSYSSLTTPNSVFDYNMETRESKLMKQDEIMGGFKSSDYQSERLWAVASDCTRVPVSIVYRKGLKKDGSHPMLLYAYGSYGYSTDPEFRPNIISLLDRGFVYAIAHVRGGSEMGRAWYENGKLFHKKNTFTDFNDCASYLISEKYTSPDRLFAQGGSAGGLLMGAVLNLRPDLYKGVIAAVPFVDVVTTMLDESIPLTTSEWDEWGDPRKKEYYDYMLSYSPYDQVSAKNYPNIITTTGLWDSQVQYWEPAKWVAKLRELKTDDNILILDCNMNAGHGGASGRFERYRVVALEYAFILDLAGINE